MVSASLGCLLHYHHPSLTPQFRGSIMGLKSSPHDKNTQGWRTSMDSIRNVQIYIPVNLTTTSWDLRKLMSLTFTVRCPPCAKRGVWCGARVGRTVCPSGASGVRHRTPKATNMNETGQLRHMTNDTSLVWQDQQSLFCYG